MLSTGFMASAPIAQVRNRFQPPSPGGAVTVRREVKVLQSMAWTSTVMPALRNACAVTSAAPLRIGMSVA